MKRTRGIVQPRATGASGAITGKMTPTSQQVASFWRGTGKLQDMGELSGQPELADTSASSRRKTGTPAVSAATVDTSSIVEDDIVEESTASGGGGGGGGGYDWLDEESASSSKPTPVGLLLLGLAGLAAWVWR